MKAALALLLLTGCAAPHGQIVDVSGAVVRCMVQGMLPWKIAIDADGDTVGIVCAPVPGAATKPEANS